jgi:hypothetical protein
MPELERDLATLATELEWPPTPDIATAVTARIAHRRPERGIARRRLAIAAIAAAAIGIPGAAIGFDWLGLRHVKVERRQHLPPARDPLLGVRLPLAEAARRADVAPLVPPAFAHATAYVTDGRLSLRLGPLLFEQRRGGLDRSLLQKLVLTTAGVERATVHGHPALWFSGAHAYLWVEPDGDIGEEPPLRSGPSLVWEERGMVLRLEGDRGLTRARALALARSARPVGR